ARAEEVEGEHVEVAEARRLARPTWVNLRTVLGGLLFAVAFLAGLRALESAADTVPVWAAARDLPVGAELQPEDLRLVEVRLPADLLGRYVSAEDDLAGSVLSRPARAGELLFEEWVGTGGAALQGRSMTIPVTPEHSVGTLLRPGDRIDVLATFDAGDVRARTFPVVREAEVLDLVAAGGLVAQERSVVGITVAVSPEEASDLAFAVRSGEIDIARVDGEGSGRASTVRATDFR
ncbi:MAG: Flp pilus assembly protein CpaB, partial [Actinomycetota bacterium]